MPRLTRIWTFRQRSTERLLASSPWVCAYERLSLARSGFPRRTLSVDAALGSGSLSVRLPLRSLAAHDSGEHEAEEDRDQQCHDRAGPDRQEDEQASRQGRWQLFQETSQLRSQSFRL